MKLFRASGQPIKEEHNELYHKELNSEMDRLEKLIGKCSGVNVQSFKKSLDKIIKGLIDKYPNEKEISMPTTVKAMKEFTSQYGGVAFCVEDGKLVAYILDQPV